MLISVLTETIGFVTVKQMFLNFASPFLTVYATSKVKVISLVGPKIYK